MNFAFRVDSATFIGSGHAMRCLTLARALSSAGHTCHFICRDLSGNINGLVEKEFTVAVLSAPDGNYHPRPEDPPHAAWVGVDWQTDAAQTCSVIGRTDWLILDHYGLDFRWEKTLFPCAGRIMVLDDLADRPHACALLLDQTLGRLASDYFGLVAANTDLLIGPTYALLRPEFGNLRQASLSRVRQGMPRNLLVSMGGVDAQDKISYLLHALANLPQVSELTVTVLISSSALHLKALQLLIPELPFAARLIVDSSHVASLMLEADAAVTAGGMLSYELASMGVPMLIFPSSSTEEISALELTKISEAFIVEEWRTFPAINFVGVLSSFLNYLIGLPSTCRRFANGIDGKGVSRTISKIAKLSG